MNLNEKIEIIKEKKEKIEIQLFIIEKGFVRDRKTEETLAAVVRAYGEIIDLLESN